MKASKFFAPILLVVICCSALSLGTSCSSHRKAGTSAPARVTAKRTPEVSALAETYAQWHDVYMPLNFRCSSPMNLSLSGRATMVAGECIHISLRMLGMEVAQVWIDTDSIFVSEKMGKSLVVEPLARLSAHTGLGISDLQALLLGQAFYPGDGALIDARRASTLFSVTQKDSDLILTPRRTPAGATWYLTVVPGPVLSELTVEPEGFKPFIAMFGDHVDSPAGKIAADVEISGNLESKNLDFEFVWNTGKAQWNQTENPVKPTWRGYRRLTARQLLESLKGYMK